MTIMAGHREAFTITDARGLAEVLHAGQVDKAGNPYIGHLHRVASYITSGDDLTVMSAYLHDSIEDTTVTARELRAVYRVPQIVVDTVALLTRTVDVPPMHYYSLIRENERALETKLGDIADHTDPRRLALLETATRDRLSRKYAKAYVQLGVDPSDGERRRAEARMTGLVR